MNFSIIQKSQLGYTDRIDAEYYQPVFLELEKSLSKFKSETLDQISLVTGGKRLPVGETFSETGIPYVRIVDIYNTFIDIDNVQLISEHLHKLLNRYQINNRDILLTIVGNTVGLIGYNQLNLNGINFTENCARIRTSKLTPEYLLIVLLSRIGQLQVSREKVGTAQPKLSLDRLRKFLIPITSNSVQQTIKTYADKALSLFEESKHLYQQAEKLLLDELGLTDFKPREDLSFVANLSEVAEANRVDSDFFQPKYEQIIEILGRKQLKKLDDYFQVIRSKYFDYSNEGDIGVIKTKQLGKQFIGFEVEDRTKAKTVEKEKLPIIKNSDVVFASMGVGSLGKTNIVYDFELNREKFTIDSTLRIFRSKGSGLLPEVLSVYLASPIGQELIYKYVVGTSGIISIYENYLSNFPVPVLPKEMQERIADLIRKSHEVRKKSKELLKEAKREVEEMIEKGGDN